jgi:uncharacterized protein YacL
LLVARFVLDELQGFADAADPVKARRARVGQEALAELSKDGVVQVRVLDDSIPQYKDVDAKLIALARRLELRLLTNDGALARNAEIQGVPSCNLRRLAFDLAPAVLPGDPLHLQLSGVGRQRGQGVGHLEDGSLVVVNGGEGLVGTGPIDLRVTSVVPTSVGRVVFATFDADDTESAADGTSAASAVYPRQNGGDAYPTTVGPTTTGRTPASGAVARG